jgi:hypothetical protein
MAVRLYVDFNTMAIDPKERVYINAHTQPVLMQELHPGLVVTLYDEEMEVEAVVEFDEHDRAWLGQPNWSTRRDLPLPSNNDARPALSPLAHYECSILWLLTSFRVVTSQQTALALPHMPLDADG